MLDSAWKPPSIGCLKLSTRGETVEQHSEAVELAHKYGMTTALFMIFGLPTETHDDRENTFRICHAMKCKDMKYNNLIPYPGTPMYETLKNSPRMVITPGWENFNSTLSITRSIFDKTPLPYVPETVSEFELKRDIMFYTLRGYLNWHTIKSVLFRSTKGAVWMSLPKRWYLKPLEIYHVAKIGIALLGNLFLAWLPLFMTEPLITFFNPELKRRQRVKNPPKEIKILEWAVKSRRMLVEREIKSDS